MGKFWNKVKSAFKAVAAVALVVIAIVNPTLIPQIGSYLTGSSAAYTAGTMTAAQMAAASAAGSAAISTASSLAQGNSLKDSLKAGAVAGVTGYVGISTATATGSASIGSAAGSAAGTLVAGGSPQDIIRNAVAGGIGAGVGDAVGSTKIGQTTGVGLAAGRGVGTLIATGGDVKQAINTAVTTQLIDLANVGYEKYKENADKPKLSNKEIARRNEQKAAREAQKLVDASKAQPGIQLADAGTGTMTDAGNQLGEIRVTAGNQAGAVENVLPFTSTTVGKTPSNISGTLPEVKVTAKRETDAPENVLPFTATDSLPEVIVRAKREPIDSLPEVKVTGEREIESLPEVEVTGDKEIDNVLPYTVTDIPKTPAKAPAKTPAKTIYPKTYFTGVSPTSGSPLAEGLNLSSAAPLPTTGLTSSRGAGEIESKESGKKRSTVWNEESLRLKDALGV